MEILVEILITAIGYAYVDFLEGIMPEKKFTEKQREWLVVLCVAVSAIMIGLIAIGGIFVSMNEQPFKTCGTVMLVVGVLIFVVNIVMCIIGRISKNEEGAEIEEEEIADTSLQADSQNPQPIVYYTEEVKMEKQEEEGLNDDQ